MRRLLAETHGSEKCLLHVDESRKDDVSRSPALGNLGGLTAECYGGGVKGAGHARSSVAAVLRNLADYSLDNRQ